MRRKPEVLIVDDEKRFRDAMRFHLVEIYQAKVRIAGSGDEAIRYLKRKKICDVIFLDIKMTGIDGIETYHRLREMNVDCEIVMMSAYENSEKWAQAQKLGVTLIPKPFPENILAKIMGNLAR